MITVGVREAKARMVELIDRALAGEEVIITRRGEQVARLEPVPEERRAQLWQKQPTSVCDTAGG